MALRARMTHAMTHAMTRAMMTRATPLLHAVPLPMAPTDARAPIVAPPNRMTARILATMMTMAGAVDTVGEADAPRTAMATRVMTHTDRRPTMKMTGGRRIRRGVLRMSCAVT